MKFNNTPNRCLIVDGKECWISRSVSVTPVLFFVIDDQGFVPLGKRGDGMPDEQGKWALPGGYLDYDETAGEAVIRETWEELGLNIPQLQTQHRFVGTLDQPYYVSSIPRRRQNVNLRFPLLFFLDSAEDLPELKPQVSIDEVLQAQWFQVKDALGMDLAFAHQDAMRQCLDTYYKDIWQC
ncbi:MAG: NUDIX hydrolase [Cyanothece sp. SIO1E1]|nr:NUDIX hydrolase [Cyanothece sp. SIO1E1]